MADDKRLKDPAIFDFVRDDPAEFRKATEELVGYGDGEWGALAEWDDIVNLNALTIGLGLESAEFEPEKLPVLVYRGGDSAVLLLAEGQAVVLDAEDEERAKKCLLSGLEDTIEVGNMVGDPEGIGLPSDVDSVEMSTMRTK